MYLGSFLVLCSIFCLVWMQQCSKKWKASSHLLTVKSGIMRCKIKAEHEPSLLVWARHCQKRRCLPRENGSALSEAPCAKGLVLGLCRSCSMVGTGPNLGHFCLTHSAFLWHFTFFTAESLCSICVTLQRTREGGKDLWLLVINELSTPRSLTVKDLTRTVQLICLS